MSHHELPEHDALDTIDEKVLKGELFFERHGKKIIIAVAAVVIVALGIFAYHRFVQVPKAEKATAQMFVAEDSFIAGQDSLALKGQGAGAPASKLSPRTSPVQTQRTSLTPIAGSASMTRVSIRKHWLS